MTQSQANRKDSQMSSHQKQLIAKLAANRVPIVATFNGDFLNCKVAVKSGKKTKWQKFSFRFDTADDCQGPALLRGSLKGAYCEAYAEIAAEIIKGHSDEIALLPV